MALGGFTAVAPGDSREWAGVRLLKGPPQVRGEDASVEEPSLFGFNKARGLGAEWRLSKMQGLCQI